MMNNLSNKKLIAGSAGLIILTSSALIILIATAILTKSWPGAIKKETPNESQAKENSVAPQTKSSEESLAETKTAPTEPSGATSSVGTKQEQSAAPKQDVWSVAEQEVAQCLSSCSRENIGRFGSREVNFWCFSQCGNAANKKYQPPVGSREGVKLCLSACQPISLAWCIPRCNSGTVISGEDSRRVSSIAEAQTALDMYFDSKGKYPTVFTDVVDISGGLNILNFNKTEYMYCSTGSKYHFGISVDNELLTAYDSDVGGPGKVVCSAGEFDGDDKVKCSSLGIGSHCYDVVGP